MRQCAFCPSTKLSQEHIWGKWINRILPFDIRFTTRRFDDIDGNDFTEWETVGLRQTAKVVCRPCNNNWMSDLENKEAKPTMSDMIRHGGAVSLLPRGIASIAAWAFKMSTIANFMNLGGAEPFFCDSERHKFKETLEVPSGIQMWLFSLNIPNRVLARFNSHVERADVKFGFEMHVSTFAVGYIGVQVVASRWSNPHMSTFMGQFPGLAEHNEWNGATVPLFPSDGSPVLWPPRFQLGSNSLHQFCHRWKTITIPSWMVDSKRLG